MQPAFAGSPSWRRVAGRGLAVALVAAASASALRGQVAGADWSRLPEAPWQSPTTAAQNSQSGGATVSGTATDLTGAVIAGAAATLRNARTGEAQSIEADASGYFRFHSVASGTYTVSVLARGFGGWSETGIRIQAGEDYDLPHIALPISAAAADVVVTVTQYDLAEEEVHAEEKQRVLGIVPNFYTSYIWHAEPLTSGQKFRLAERSTIDPFSFVGTGVLAGIQQAQNDLRGYGQGAAGYAKRYGADYADNVIGTMVGGAVLPVLFHQDPRYYYKGKGSIASRALYAIATTVICRGDNGHWEPNYSNVLGNLAAGGLSNLYYPASDRNGASTTIDSALIATASGAIGALFQEFLLPRLTTGRAPKPTP